MSLDFKTIRDISLAALLHDIGKMGQGNQLNRFPHEMSDSELKDYQQHPLRGQFVLEQIESLQHVSLMIRHHHESYNGSGFPSGLKGDAIPLGAQLIGIADFIDHAAQSVTDGQAEYAMKKLSLSAGTLFNPDLIQHFRSVVRSVYYRGQRRAEAVIEVEIPPTELVAGMQVTRDVITGSGMMLAEKGTELETGSIAIIQKYFKTNAPDCGIFVSLSSPV